MKEVHISLNMSDHHLIEHLNSGTAIHIFLAMLQCSLR